MLRVLLVFVVHACCAVAVTANAGTAVPHEATEQLKIVVVLKPSADNRMQPGSTNVVVRSTSPDASTATSLSSEDDRATHGTVLATLVLMGVIALRRHRSGKL